MPAPLVAAAAKVGGQVVVGQINKRFPGGIVAFCIVIMLGLVTIPAGLLMVTVNTVLSAASLGGAASENGQCGDSGGPPSPLALKDISAVALDAYYKAATSTGVDWAVIAGIGKIESGHGTYAGSKLDTAGNDSPPILGHALDGSGVGGNTTPIYATPATTAIDGDPVYQHAVGPMQFLSSTWVGVGRDGNGDGKKDPQNIYDAALATGDYLKSNGALTNMYNAIFHYNHLDSYVRQVMQYADEYRASGATDAPTAGAVPSPTTSAPSADPTATTLPVDDGPAAVGCNDNSSGTGGPLPAGAAGSIIAFAQAQLGKPYVFAASGPNAFDCSGLALGAYKTVGVNLPHLAALQWKNYPHVPIGQEQPGDLVFFVTDGTRDAPGHVGIVTDPATHQMINAEHEGVPIKYASYVGFDSVPIVGFSRPPVPAAPAA